MLSSRCVCLTHAVKEGCAPVTILWADDEDGRVRILVKEAAAIEDAAVREWIEAAAQEQVSAIFEALRSAMSHLLLVEFGLPACRRRADAISNAVSLAHHLRVAVGPKVRELLTSNLERLYRSSKVRAQDYLQDLGMLAEQPFPQECPYCLEDLISPTSSMGF